MPPAANPYWAESLSLEDLCSFELLDVTTLVHGCLVRE